MVEICSFVASYLFVAERRRVYCSVQESGASIRDEQTWGARYLFAGVVSYVFNVDFVTEKTDTGRFREKETPLICCAAKQAPKLIQKPLYFLIVTVNA